MTVTRQRPRTIRFLPLAVLLLLGGCLGTTSRTQGGSEANAQPWLTSRGPDWEQLVPIRFERVLFVQTSAIVAEGDVRTAPVLMNFGRPNRTPGGQVVRSQLYRMQAHCADRTYRPIAGALYEQYAGAGDPVSLTRLETEPFRPVIPGSAAEQIVEALCRS